MKQLETTTETLIRFGDLDPMGIVWHGNYIKFLELGREAFGREHDVDSVEMYGIGYFTPIVRVNVDHKAMLGYGDTVVIRTWIVPSPAAKLIFRYELRRRSDGAVVASAETVQVFLDRDKKLMLDIPEFFRLWKERHQIA
jgi:acyl-CoA thioester hydrolase